MKKKIWDRPKLVVLYRGNPEESVLTGCKTASNPSGGQTAVHGACMKVTGPKCQADCKASVTS